MARNPEREALLDEVRALAEKRGIFWIRDVVTRAGAGHLRELTTRELRIIAAS